MSPIKNIRPLRTARSRGSVLAVALIFSVALGILTATYLQLAMNEFRRAEESLHFNGLVNLAEAGAEEAAWALINDDWSSWLRQDGQFAWKRMTGIPAGGGREGSVLIMLDGYQDNRPTITIESQVTSPRQRTFTKQVRMQLQHRSMFANGLTARDKLRFVGGVAEIDSYDSRKGDYHPTVNRGDRGTAGSLLVEHDAVDLGNAKVWGYVATGGSDPSVGPTGWIRGADTVGTPHIDWNRVTRDFYAEFPSVALPTTGGLPLPGGNTKNIGNSGTVQTYRLDELDLKSNETLNINGPVVIIIEGDTDIKGTLNINDGGSATIYANGDFVVGGNGSVNNTNVPAALAIFGTNPTEMGQNITLHGRGELSGVVYAPNAYLSLRGGGATGTMKGAAVAYRIFVNGTYAFRYDEALDDFGGGRPTFRLRRWQELIGPNERVDLAALTAGLSIPTENFANSLYGGTGGTTGQGGN